MIQWVNDTVEWEAKVVLIAARPGHPKIRFPEARTSTKSNRWKVAVPRRMGRIYGEPRRQFSHGCRSIRSGGNPGDKGDIGIDTEGPETSSYATVNAPTLGAAEGSVKKHTEP